MAVVVNFRGDEIIKGFEKVIGDKALEVAEMVASKARMLAPSETGALRRSIKAKPSKFKNGGAVVNVGGGAQYYASFVELGTSKQIASPFMRPAIEMTRRRAKSLIIRALQRKNK